LEEDVKDSVYPADGDIIGFSHPDFSFIKNFSQENQEDARPILLSEYANIEQNGAGSLLPYIELFQQDSRFMGGFIHSWNALTKLKAQPDLWEIKALFAPFMINPKDLQTGEFYITSLLDYTFLSRYECCYQITRYGKEVQAGSIGVLPVLPGQCRLVQLPYTLPQDGDCYVKIFFRLFGDTPYGKSETEMGFSQFKLPVAPVERENHTENPPVLEEKGTDYIISANKCRFVFSTLYGTLTQISVENQNLLVAPLALQCALDNEWQARCHHAEFSWQENLLTITATLHFAKKGYPVLVTARVDYTFFGDGTVACRSQWENKEDSSFLPHAGLQMILSDTLCEIQYYGLGPHENYTNRNRSVYVGEFSQSLFESPQNRHGFCCKLTNPKGIGLAVRQEKGMDFSAHKEKGAKRTILHLHALPQTIGKEPTKQALSPFEFTFNPIFKENHTPRK
jgi:beta-galactosidase